VNGQLKRDREFNSRTRDYATCTTEHARFAAALGDRGDAAPTPPAVTATTII
jgi:hypothetical protein